MRFLQLNTDGGYYLKKDIVDNLPPYIIIWHTWDFDDDEATFVDIANNPAQVR
jgi:hypothetical protein